MEANGAIYLVGTGPGDRGLITVKGLALVREADAIVGDLLAQAELLREARPDVEQYDVGCRTSQSNMSQEEINALLVRLARQGKTVVRLWPGDPFVFGRAAQELARARQASIRVEVVPGLTSAIAAPAYAGVPVTHWEHNTSFAVVSGYESKNPAVTTDWAGLARLDTLIILMPLDDLPQIVEKLLAAGRSADTPALVVQNGTLPQQKQVLATLETLSEAVAKHNLGPPAIVVVGQVAQLTEELAWFETGPDQPLRGKRVLVTRPFGQAGEFMAALRALGAEPVAFPTIEIEPVVDTGPLDAAIERIRQHVTAWQQGLAANSQGNNQNESPPTPPYDWLVLTSVNGVAAFWARLAALGLDSRILTALKIAAIGPATAAALEQRSITPDLVPEAYTAEGVLEAFDKLGPVRLQRFLLARADIARSTLRQGLRERGALVEEIAAYRTVPRPVGPLPPAAEIVTFTSSSTVQGYVNCLSGRSPQEYLHGREVVCIGPITAQTAKELGLPITAVADAYTIEGILDVLARKDL